MAFCFNTVFITMRCFGEGRNVVDDADFTLKISIFGKRFFCQL
jgi:hypothetical protein